MSVIEALEKMFLRIVQLLIAQFQKTSNHLYNQYDRNILSYKGNEKINQEI